MLTKAAKQDIIDKYNDAFKANPSVLVVEYKGLTVKEMEGLRSDLGKAEGSLQVVKNTLLIKASKDTEVEQIEDLFVGPTAVAICESDPASIAKVFVKTGKDNPNLKIKGGIVEGKVVGAEDIAQLSKLPSREEMLAQLMGMLKAPISNFLGVTKQMQSKLLYALTAIKETKENE